MNKLFRRSYLDKRLAEAGICGAKRGYFWVYKMEKRGKLRLPRDPVTGHRKLTKEQAEEIVKEFSPGGKGRWIF